MTVTSVMTVSTLTQFSLSAVGPFVISDLQLSASSYGSLFTAYFACCAVGSFLLGALTQRVGARRGMTLVGLLSAAGFLAMSQAPSLALVYVGLLLAGLAGAISNPATNLALMREPNRGYLVGIKQSGVQLSALLGGLLVAPLASAFGWRAALLACAIICLLPIPSVWRLRLREGEYAERTATGSQTGSIASLATFAVLMGAGSATCIAYLPVYATDDLGLSPRVGGYLLALFGAFAVVGRIGWAYISERSPWFARPHVSLGILAVAAVAATGIVALAAVGPEIVIYAGAALVGLTGAAWNGLVMSFVMVMALPDESGRAAGRVQAGLFTGLCLGPLAFGLVLDATGSFGYGWGLTALFYAGALGVACTSISRPAGAPPDRTAPNSLSA